jgi:hypothetical protein
MAIEIGAVDEQNQKLALKLDKFPGMCPVCKRHIDARLLGASLYSYQFHPLYAAFICPVEMCRAIFVATYRVSTSRASNSFPAYLMDVKVLTHTAATPFPASVNSTSPQFAKIFEEARTADENGLKEIAGPGYRKALEYLVKDFLLHHQLKNDPDAKVQVLKLMLGACIERFVDDPRIKAVAKRAAWLGNDETHYYRRWTDKDLDDLKKLVTMSVSWIDLNVTSAEYEQSMPES